MSDVRSRRFRTLQLQIFATALILSGKRYTTGSWYAKAGVLDGSEQGSSGQPIRLYLLATRGTCKGGKLSFCNTTNSETLESSILILLEIRLAATWTSGIK